MEVLLRLLSIRAKLVLFQKLVLQRLGFGVNGAGIAYNDSWLSFLDGSHHWTGRLLDGLWQVGGLPPNLLLQGHSVFGGVVVHLSLKVFLPLFYLFLLRGSLRPREVHDVIEHFNALHWIFSRLNCRQRDQRF